MTRNQANALVTAVLIAAIALATCAYQLARIRSDVASIDGSQADLVELAKQNPARQR